MSSRSKWGRVGLVAGALLLALAGAELLLHARPDLLPAWYRATLPEDGLELFHPGLLARTPLEVVPLPRLWSRGVRPPADLSWNYGLFAPHDNPDLQRWPELVWPRDELGLPNPALPERADLLLVGDSFAFWSGLQSPPGLVPLLGGRTGLSVLDLGVIGIGPHQERSLLESVGLPRDPRAVVWLFFGGNDVQDALNVAYGRSQGLAVHADRQDYRAPPALLLLDLLRQRSARPTRRTHGDPLRPVPPVRLPSAGEGPGPALWLAPPYLRNLVLTRDDWTRHGGWAPTQQVLRETAALLAARGVALLLVYVPSKAQAYVPLLARQAEALHAMAFHERRGQVTIEPQDFVQRAIRHADELERLVEETCAEQGIAYLSLTPLFREQGARGVLAYMAGDTHWSADGQALALEPIAERLLALLAER